AHERHLDPVEERDVEEHDGGEDERIAPVLARLEKPRVDRDGDDGENRREGACGEVPGRVPEDHDRERKKRRLSAAKRAARTGSPAARASASRKRPKRTPSAAPRSAAPMTSRPRFGLLWRSGATARSTTWITAASFPSSILAASNWRARSSKIASWYFTSRKRRTNSSPASGTLPAGTRMSPPPAIFERSSFSSSARRPRYCCCART